MGASSVALPSLHHYRFLKKVIYPGIQYAAGTSAKCGGAALVFTAAEKMDALMAMDMNHHLS